MAAYGAAVSLLKTLRKLQSSPNHPQIEAFFKAVDSLKCFLVENVEVEAELEAQIRDAIYETEGTIDYYMWSVHFLSVSQAEISSQSFHEDLDRLKHKIDLIAEMTLRMVQRSPDHLRIEALFEAVQSLKCFLVENREVKAEFETQIRDAIYEAQDIIDSHMWSAHFLSPSEAEISSNSFHEDLERVKQKINLIAEMTAEEFNHSTLDRKISTSVWRNSDQINFLKQYRVIGRDRDIYELKDRLMNGSDGLQLVPIVGVAGMGKTALARCLLKDPMIVNHFDVIGWVKVSAKCSKRDKFLDILASLRKSSVGILDMVDELVEYEYSWSHEMQQKTDKELVKQINNSLKHKRFCILLDDIRNVDSWNDLKELFPDYYTRSRILLTTRDVKVTPARPHLLDRLSDEATLALLEEIVFDGEPCPAHLTVIAKDIAWSCRGLPHAVSVVGKLLTCANQSAAYWEIVLASIISMEKHVDLIETLLSLTYNHLPQQLKVCLLYMAIFPYNCVIPWLKLAIQSIVEGFMGEVGGDLAYMLQIAKESQLELFERCFLVLRVKSRDILNARIRIAEEVFHDFLVRKAKEEKFFLVIKKDESHAFRQGDTGYNQQRRLCIQQNIHHWIKDLSACNKNLLARSLIYSGPESQYRIRVWSEEFKLLEVLDAVKIGFYTFPLEILKLIQLKYLAFSYNGQLPMALCHLRNLQVLIVSQYLNMKCSGVPSYLPVEIWNLKDLMHLQVEGSDLPEPPSGTKLENLRQLLDVSAHSCTRNIFKRVPSLLILEVRIESSQEEDETLSFFSYLDILKVLLFFKCIVIYPDIGSQVVPCSLPVFPSTLIELNLNGFGFPWEYMRAIAALPQLQVLRLQNYAFQGPEWEVKTNEFPKLEKFLLEDMDLENWAFDSGSGSIFPILESLIIRNCYKLRHIPSVFADSSTLKLLEVVDCSTSAMNSALEIKEVMRKRGNRSIPFDVYSSRDD